MPKRYFYKALICLVMLSIILVGGSYTTAKAAQSIQRQICVGYWDIWRHSDGVTWQYTGSPGQQKNHTFELETPESMVEYQNVDYKIISTEITEEIYNRLGGYQGMNYDDFDLNIYRYLPDDYHQIADKTVSLKLDGFYEEIKKDWQNQLVEGRRWYLPVVIEWYGDPAFPPKQKASAKLGCLEQPSITQKWDELYTWEVYHHATCTATDEEGNPISYDCSWTETKWDMPTYSETLSASITVNTKQGIPTDPKNLKESDRESRGSWEIIPDTKQRIPKYSGKQGIPYKDINIYGWDPNEVTRAGYGFEVKVQTWYTTDWEMKVPDGADAHGGKYYGPRKVTAYFYDTYQHQFVESVSMVATQGKPGDKNITWELPEKKHVFQDGKTIWERKHYTDINTKDGYYEVVVYIEEAGKHDLCLIQAKEVAIYGDAYDDISTRIDTEDK